MKKRRTFSSGNVDIRSADQAFNESRNLEKVWSYESRLTQRILIYIARLLENQARRKKRPTTAWQRFASRAVKDGKTLQQAAAEWKRSR